MIEIVSAERCTACNICVHACPTNVFDLVAGGPPRIARQSDCQTCFMCELYCPVDALYVAPSADSAQAVEEAAARPLMGSYRAAIGWGAGRTATARHDSSFELLMRAH
ncbi:4Fe-4S dicluster domain-containing protein [Pigmentiphaga kullae]|uniref:NAD-dependent dihydropyrimidine dehydrogenase PreA subunit n=1 Tax=Pigmentiphaga kullae TaxID=151784 RepID=A0A4Q7NBS2_9BURK|nr:ferredoxin family protein [Pigmentiphaga kullae]RZS80365.1 NAD-dependent dihydropyrimidine dehydrogenase PreA subunit [Pigmentiphaga kullae]